MRGFDKMFDFNRDGKLDRWERAMQLQFLDEISRKENSGSDDAILEEAGLDHDELELMDPDERREALEDAGLDPDDYDDYDDYDFD